MFRIILIEKDEFKIIPSRYEKEKARADALEAELKRIKG